MIYFIAMLLFLILCFIHEELLGFWISMTIISLIVFLIVFINGLGSYPALLSNQEKIVMLEKGISEIRNAYYKTQENSSAIISGNIENMQQSKVLSKYISNIYQEKSNFNQNLINNKFYEKSRIMFWFADGMFIDKRVHEIKSFK